MIKTFDFLGFLQRVCYNTAEIPRYVTGMIILSMYLHYITTDIGQTKQYFTTDILINNQYFLNNIRLLYLIK